MIVPFNCDAVVGEALDVGLDSDAFMGALQASLDALLTQCMTRREALED